MEKPTEFRHVESLAALIWYLCLTSVAEPDDSYAKKDKHFRKYASAVDKALALFETTLQEWADYISFLNRLLKVRTGHAAAPIAVTRG